MNEEHGGVAHGLCSHKQNELQKVRDARELCCDHQVDDSNRRREFGFLTRGVLAAFGDMQSERVEEERASARIKANQRHHGCRHHPVCLLAACWLLEVDEVQVQDQRLQPLCLHRDMAN